MAFTYVVYGLTISSDCPFPDLIETSGSAADLSVFLASQPAWLRRAERLPVTHRLARGGDSEQHDPTFVLSALGSEEFFRLEYSDGARFVVDRAATRLWGTWGPPLTFEDLVSYVLGPILGFVLRRRGVLALHASSVVVGEHAVVLAGPSEAGKSTTAGALSLRGESVLTEDLSPLAEERGRYFVEPGYPRVCLWPDSVEKLFGAAQALPLLAPNWEKRYLPLEDGRGRFAAQRLPLGAIYLLGQRTGESDAPRVEALGPRAALLELVQNTYTNYLLDRPQRATEFDALSRLVQRVPVRRITPHADLARLPALCDLLLSDAHHSLGSEQPAAAACGP